MAGAPDSEQLGVKFYKKDCPKVGAAGPWKVRILTANPSAPGARVMVTAARSGHITGPSADSYGLRVLSALAPKGGVLAAVNGGYFVRNPEAYPDNTSPGTPGESAGLSVMGGKYFSEPTNGRAVLVLGDGGRKPQIKKFSTRIELSVDEMKDGAWVRKYTSGTKPPGAEEETPWIDGINRSPGQIRNCGGTADDLPSPLPRHDDTCSDGDELVFLTTGFGSPRPGAGNGPGTELVLDETGKVLQRLGARGGQVADADGKQFLQGTGTAATWLKNVAVDDRVAFRVIDTSPGGGGEELTFGAEDAVVNGGPVLVSGGVETDFRTDDSAYVADGLKYSGNAGFTSWVGPNPRTLAGFVTADGGTVAKGTIFLVTVDRIRDATSPDASAGLTIPEAADLMAALGVQEAINLDGGGSTTMVVDGTVKNHPSDRPTAPAADAQRLIADAVVLRARPGSTTGVG